MAKVLVKTGRYVADQAIKKYQQQFIVIFLVFFCLAFLLGHLLGKNFHPYSISLRGQATF